MRRLTESEIIAIRQRAEELYRDGSFVCSEAVLKTVLDGFGVAYPAGVLAMASGFGGGVGGGGCICGAISGGSMAMSYLFGRSVAGDARVKDAMSLSRSLHAIFVSRHRVACCKSLIRGLEYGSAEHVAQCSGFSGEMAESAARLINDHLPEDL